MFDKQLLDIIACPVCKGKLALVKNAPEVLGMDNSEQDNSVQLESSEPHLLCKFDKLVFNVHKGIPVLLEDEALSVSFEQLEQLK